MMNGRVVEFWTWCRLPYETRLMRYSCLGLIIAPLVAAIAAGMLIAWFQPVMWSASEVVFLLATFGAYPATALLALPMLLLLRGRVRVTPLICGLIGCAIGLAALFVWSSGRVLNFGTGEAVLVAIAGVVGGVTFWCIAHKELNEPLPTDRSLE